MINPASFVAALVPGTPRYQWPPPLPGSFHCCGDLGGKQQVCRRWLAMAAPQVLNGAMRTGELCPIVAGGGRISPSSICPCTYRSKWRHDVFSSSRFSALDVLVTSSAASLFNKVLCALNRVLGEFPALSVTWRQVHVC